MLPPLFYQIEGVVFQEEEWPRIESACALEVLT
jgi:hypothetical protein